MSVKRRSRARAATERVATARRSSRPSFLSSPRGSFATVFASASIIRLAVAATTADLPIVRTPKLDSAEYVSWARRMSEGNFAWPAVSAHGPGYPLFLAGIFALGGSNWAAIVIQSLLGGLTAAFIAMLGSRWFGSRAGLWSGLLYATLAPAVYVETNLLAEGLLLCVLTAALVVLSTERLATARAFGGGALLGFAMLVRPTAALMFLAVVAALWQVARQRRLAVTTAIVCGGFVVLAPALIKNWSASRTLGIQGFGGLNFYIGNSPLHNGRPVFRLGAGWDALNSEAERAGLTDQTAQDRYYIRKAFNEISAHPAAYLRLLGEKILWLVQASEVRDSHSFYFFTSQSSLLGILPRMALLVPLAAIGVAVLAARRRVPPLLAAYTIGAALSVVVLVVGTRYRLPLAPSFAILGGIGIVGLIDAVLHSDRRQLAGMAFVGVAAVVVSHLLRDRPSTNLSEEWAFTGSALITEHRLPEAERAYRRALDEDAQSGLAWDGLGLALFDEQRWPESRAALERALQLDPESARTAYHLGLVDEAENRPSDAVAHLRAALLVDATNLDAARHLATNLTRLRKDDDAIVVLDDLIRHAPNDAEAHRALGGALGGVGRLRDAKAELTTSVRLTPSNGEAWLDLCLVSLDLGEIKDAAEACRTARADGAAPERLAIAERALSARRQ
ncbi:MAG TPA: tetratricopeptide repeat protein [Vicinamibacterales bacterium]